MILRGVTCLTMDAQSRVLSADMRIDPGGRIDAFLPPGRSGYPGEEEIILPGRIVIPGLIQTHVHLCQTLFRGMAERRRLGSWLRDRIWPLEAAHDEETLRASAHLGLLELLTGGTTSILDMGTTRRTGVILEACSRAGIRALTGSALMDEGAAVPETLIRDIDESIEETRNLMRLYAPGGGDRVGLCVAPRFIPSVSEPGWHKLVAFADENQLRIHTHACETPEEIDETRSKTGAGPFAYLERVGAAGPRLVAAHGVWLDKTEHRVLRQSGSSIVHCPGSNAKLGSGRADVIRLFEEGVQVGIGTDGAACNNRLDGFEELRRAAHTISTLHGPERVDAAEIVRMATRTGARILGMEGSIGSLEPGKDADLVVLNPALGPGLWSAAEEPHAQLLYGAGREQVEQVWIGGEKRVERGRLRGFSTPTVLRKASAAARTLKERILTQ